jgi:hypothetical protein
MANRLVSVWLGQCAAAGNAHFQLAKVIEPRRYPARALTRFARRRGRTRLLPALAPHRVSRNRCEERVPLVLRNGHGTLLSIHGVRASHSHEKQAPEPGKPARPSGSGVPAAQESFLGCPLLHNERTATLSHWEACLVAPYQATALGLRASECALVARTSPCLLERLSLSSGSGISLLELITWRDRDNLLDASRHHIKHGWCPEEGDVDNAKPVDDDVILKRNGDHYNAA